MREYLLRFARPSRDLPVPNRVLKCALNPIEQAFSKVKNTLRKMEAGTREAVVEAMGPALDAVTTADARGFFKHAGYRALDQRL